MTYNPATTGNTSESTYYPNCVPNTITITLDKNGGTGVCGGQSGTTSGSCISIGASVNGTAPLFEIIVQLKFTLKALRSKPSNKNFCESL